MRRVKQLLRRFSGAAKSAPHHRRGHGSLSSSVPPQGSLAPFDLAADDVVRDPYPFYTRLRDEDRVHRCESGAWLLTRYDDVLAALTDLRLGNAPSPYAVVHERNRERYVCADVASHIIPFFDAPRHTAPRKLIGKCFRDQLRTRPIPMAPLAEETLEKAKTQSSFDLISDFATPFSVGVLGQLMGIPEKDFDQLIEWSEWFFYLFMQIPNEETRKKMDRALVEFRRYFRTWLDERRVNPGDDLLSQLVLLEGDSLSRQDIVDTCMLLFADGVENVDKAIAGTYLALREHPNELQALRDDPSLLEASVDELLRFDSPAQLVGRVALEDFSLCGKDIKRGASVLLGLGSANRDPRHFENPNRLDLRRDARSQLGFGRARHTCIGAPLVRQEIIAGLQALLASQPLRINGQSIEYHRRPGHRWLKELSVSVS